MSATTREQFVRAMRLWEPIDYGYVKAKREAVEAFARVQHDADQLDDAIKFQIVCSEPECIEQDIAALLRDCGLESR